MNSRISAWAGLILGAASLLIWTRPAAADDSGIPATAKLAVCDPIKVFSDCMEGKDFQAKWKQEEETLTNQAAAKKSELQNEADELKLIKQGSDEFETKVEKFTDDQSETQAWAQSAQMNMARKQRLEQKALIEKILSKIGDIAKGQGVMVVMNSAQPDFPEIDKMDPNAFYQTILMHTALFADPSLDITQKVIIAMDQAYSTSH